MKDKNIAIRLQRIDRPTYRPIKLIITIVFCWVWAAAPALAQTQQFNIPAQALDNALTELADTADLKLLFQSAVVRNLKSHAVSGNYTPKQALDIMLDGTGLNSRSTGTNAVTIEKQTAKMVNQNVALVGKEPGQGSGGDTTLPKITVEADSAYDPEYYADPYNKDYVLPNATAGTKTDTPIMETPLNVQVISKQVLKDQQVINLGQALKNVSGVTTGGFGNVSTGNTGAPIQNINLRGFASETFFRNGFRLQQGAASREMANVESVEVLKGPAAILYGLVEPGGMVNVTTKQPLVTPYYALTQQFGSYDLYRTTIDTTGPLTKSKDLLYRMNFSYENSGSFRDFVFNDSLFLAPVLKWNISPNTQATLEMEYQHKKFGADTGYVPIINNRILNIPISRNYGEPSPGEQDNIFVGLNWSHQFNDDWAIKHRFSANKVDSDVPLASYPAFQLGDPLELANFQSFFPNVNFDNPNRVYRRTYFNQKANTDTYSTNLDLTGHFETFGLKHTLLIGGDYYRIDQDSRSVNDDATINNWLFNGGPEPSNIDLFNPVHPGRNPGVIDPASFVRTITKTDQYGLYAQDQIKLPYNLHVMGGIRYQYLHQSSENQDSSGAITPQDPTTQDAVTPRVGILWQPQSWLSLYANFAESFGANVGRAFVSPGVTKSIDPSSATQYEGGIKTEFFGGRLRAALAYYDLTKTNVASGDANPGHDCGGGPGSCSIAIGEIRSRGPELDIYGEILPGWNVIATWANTDIRITKTNSLNEQFLGVISPGSRLWGVPRNTASLFTTYEFQQDLLKGFKIGGGVNIQDAQTACCTNPSYNIAGFTTVDLLAAYTLDIKDAKISAQLNVNNLLDKRYYTGAAIDGVGSSSGSGMYATFSQPRTFMGSISVQY
ncbi:MAG: TonB-dependent receptor [Methyloglobulus sp.]|nr:TonB-dependent receptor [Methyloglobulus sp.]